MESGLQSGLQQGIRVHGAKVVIRPLTNREVLGQERKPSPIVMVEVVQRQIYQDWFENGRYGEVVAVGSAVGYNTFLDKYVEAQRPSVGSVVRLGVPLANARGVVGADVINTAINGRFYTKRVGERGEMIFFECDGAVVDGVHVQVEYKREVWEEVKNRLRDIYWVKQELGVSSDPEFKTDWDKKLVPTSYILPAYREAIES